jgi:general secretion pathway protein B
LSYILDALKKADAERERSAVPGLHAHPLDGPAGHGRREGRLPWPALAITAIVLLAAALAWMLWSDRGVRMPPLVAEAPLQPATPVTPAPAPAPLPAPLPAAEAQPPLAQATPPQAAAPSAPPRHAAAPPPVAPALPPRATPSQAPAPVARAVEPAAPKPAASAALAQARVPLLSELPADVRATLPPLAISGAVFSPTPSARMLFINGQVLREGEAVADGVTVERIGAAASVLSARGVRFEIKH